MFNRWANLEAGIYYWTDIVNQPTRRINSSCAKKTDSSFPNEWLTMHVYNRDVSTRDSCAGVQQA